MGYPDSENVLFSANILGRYHWWIKSRSNTGNRWFPKPSIICADDGATNYNCFSYEADVLENTSDVQE
jgi:hypothetical protein